MDVPAGAPLLATTLPWTSMEVLSASSRARQTELRSNGHLHPREETEAWGYGPSGGLRRMPMRAASHHAAPDDQPGVAPGRNIG